MKLRDRLLTWAICLLLTTPAWAHIGSKDVFEQVNAGPYTLFVTIRPPNVIPGVASIEVRTSEAAVTSILITPTPLTGEASKHPPTADSMQRSKDDPAFFTGALWIMASGSWQVHFDLQGASGPASVSVPLAAMPLSILPMQRSMGTMLAVLGLILIVGIAGIVAAAVRESRLTPGTLPDAGLRRKALAAGIAMTAIAALIVYGGYKWWDLEATAYASDIYHPLSLSPELSGNTLDLKIGTYDGDRLHRFRARSNRDLLPDHGHLMHLYAIRQPGMDAVFHLHPLPVSGGELRMELPAMPPGNYRLYGDIVHANGLPETLTSELFIPPGMPAAQLASDDASGSPPALAQKVLGTDYKLPDGYTMHWNRPVSLTANTPYAFHFDLLDTAGKPATGVHPYLGMAGHAAFVKTDGTVFAHTHPEGSAAMQAMMLANGGSQEMPGMDMHAGMESIPPAVAFPYGFPSPGRYRIFVQMKHGTTVETGAFDAEVQ